MSRTKVPQVTLVPTSIPSRVMPAGAFGTQNPAGRRRQLPPPLLMQPGPVIALEYTNDRQLNDMQRKMAHAVQQAKGNPMALGHMIEAVSFVGGVQQTIAHGLGKPIRGVNLHNPSAFTRWSVVRPGTNPAQDATQVLITCESTCVADVWVYG